MELITDFATPVELTGAARASLADYEVANGTLAQFLPNITSESRIAKFSIAATGLAEAADYRSWDAEASIGFGAEGDGSGLAELPPVSQKLRISELDTVDSSVASAPEWKRNIAVKKAAEASRAIADRVEFARGQALQNGKVVIADSGFSATVDFDRPAELTATAGTLLTAPDADLFEILDAAVSVFEDANGGAAPAQAIVSRKVISLALKSAAVIATVDGQGSTARRVSIDALNSSLAENGLPTLVGYNRRINKGGTLTRVLDETLAVLVAEDAGRTVFGPTAEANEPGYGLAAEDRPGIAVGAYKTNDPIATWVKAAATALPILANGSRTMSLKVL